MDIRLVPMRPPGRRDRAGAHFSDGWQVDAPWHKHDMHQLLYAFQGSVEVEGRHGRYKAPRQFAVWIPAGAVHRTTIQKVRSGSAFFAIIFLAELANYSVHRLSHCLTGHRYFDWLWRLHRTHHTAKYVNVLLTYRLNLFWGLVSGLSWVAGLAFYLGQKFAAGAAMVIFSAWGIITHSHFRRDDAVRKHRLVGPAFRALEHVVVSPGIHHNPSRLRSRRSELQEFRRAAVRVGLDFWNTAYSARTARALRPSRRHAPFGGRDIFPALLVQNTRCQTRNRSANEPGIRFRAITGHRRSQALLS